MGQSCTIPGNCHLPYTDEETRAASGQLGGLGLVGGALKNTSAFLGPPQTDEAQTWGGASKLVFF